MSFDRHAAHRALAALCSVLNERHAGKYWVTCGTLLGIVREGDFLSHDSDVDVAMFAEDIDEALLVALAAAGFELRKTYGRVGANLLLVKLLRWGIKLGVSVCLDLVSLLFNKRYRE